MYGKLSRIRVVLAVILIVSAVVTVNVPTTTTDVADAALLAVGPVNPQTHVPEYYEDANGLQLKLCINDPALCLAEPPDPANPYSVETGFGAEAFWWAAETSMPAGVGGSALLVLAIEAAYAFEDPEPGGQMTFGRIRLRADGLLPNTGYTFIHPYGTQNLTTEADGTVFFTEDIGCLATIPGVIPCDFNLALNTTIGPYLVWDPAVAPAAPPGTIGDPSVEHTVVGSPLGTNFYRLEGPNAGGLGIDFVQKDLFVVQGKLFDNRPVAVDDTANVPAGSANRPINVLANDSDRDGNPLTVTAVTQPASGSVTIASGGTHVIFTSGAAGAATFDYTVSSTMPGNAAKTDTGTVTINVHDGNAAPVAVNDTATVAPNSGATAINVLANDSDSNNDIVNISAVTQPPDGLVTVNAAGTSLSYTPNAAFFGNDTFTYTVTDGVANATGTVTVIVNNAPTAVADSVTVNMNSTNNAINVLTNDSDADGQVLIVTAVSAPNFGTAVVGPFGGSVVYTPPPGFQGSASFNYTVSDNVSTATGTVNVTVVPNKIMLPLIFR
jgi:hypothetical protein